MIRDYQRTKVWRAFWEWSPTITPKHLSVHEIRIMLAAILADNNASVHINIDEAKGGRSAYSWMKGDTAHFRFPRKHRVPWVVCREAAHIIAGEPSGHDWYYCRRLLRLVRQYVGPHEAASLLTAFQKHGVKLTEHRKERWRKPFRFSDPSNRIR